MHDVVGLLPLIMAGVWVASLIGVIAFYVTDERRYGSSRDEDPIADDADRLWLIAEAERHASDQAYCQQMGLRW